MRPLAPTDRGLRGIAIVGPGRVGQALGKLLKRAGEQVRLLAARRRGSAVRAAQFIGGGRAVGLMSPELADAQVLLLTTADAALPHVTRGLASLREDWSGKVVLHTCGSLSAGYPDGFRLLRQRGAAVGSLHPFQTIPNPAAGARNLVGCYWTIEGDSAARKLAARWVKGLHGTTVRVNPSKKTLYHLAAFLVCPTVVALMDRSHHFLRRAGVPHNVARRMLGKIVAETARNFTELGARRALTGPVARGDWTTVRRHLRALRQVCPELIPAYVTLLREMARLAGKRLPGKAPFVLAGKTR